MKTEALKRYYRDFNQRYFGGSLPASCVVRFAGGREFPSQEVIGDCGYLARRGRIPPDIGLAAKNRSEIRIRSSLRDYRAFVVMTLLHEMVHLKLRGRRCLEHGRSFNGEMRRLAAAGAFDRWW